MYPSPPVFCCLFFSYYGLSFRRQSVSSLLRAFPDRRRTRTVLIWVCFVMDFPRDMSFMYASLAACFADMRQCLQFRQSFGNLYDAHVDTACNLRHIVSVVSIGDRAWVGRRRGKRRRHAWKENDGVCLGFLVLDLGMFVPPLDLCD